MHGLMNDADAMIALLNKRPHDGVAVVHMEYGHRPRHFAAWSAGVFVIAAILRSNLMQVNPATMLRFGGNGMCAALISTTLQRGSMVQAACIKNENNNHDWGS
jgi:hypothetical protein